MSRYLGDSVGVSVFLDLPDLAHRCWLDDAHAGRDVALVMIGGVDRALCVGGEDFP